MRGGHGYLETDGSVLERLKTAYLEIKKSIEVDCLDFDIVNDFLATVV